MLHHSILVLLKKVQGLQFLYSRIYFPKKKLVWLFCVTLYCLFHISPAASSQGESPRSCLLCFLSFVAALTASESDGSLLIEQYAACPLCASLGQQRPEASWPSEDRERGGLEGDKRGGSAEVHYFNMEDCVLAAVEKEHIICPQHPELPVPLQELVPELFMTDFPSR